MRSLNSSRSVSTSATTPVSFTVVPNTLVWSLKLLKTGVLSRDGFQTDADVVCGSRAAWHTTVDGLRVGRSVEAQPALVLAPLRSAPVRRTQAAGRTWTCRVGSRRRPPTPTHALHNHAEGAGGA